MRDFGDLTMGIMFTAFIVGAYAAAGFGVVALIVLSPILLPLAGIGWIVARITDTEI